MSQDPAGGGQQQQQKQQRGGARVWPALELERVARASLPPLSAGWGDHHPSFGKLTTLLRCWAVVRAGVGEAPEEPSGGGGQAHHAAAPRPGRLAELGLLPDGDPAEAVEGGGGGGATVSRARGVQQLAVFCLPFSSSVYPSPCGNLLSPAAVCACPIRTGARARVRERGAAGPGGAQPGVSEERPRRLCASLQMAWIIIHRKT
jgi:hypothetical protein